MYKENTYHIIIFLCFFNFIGKTSYPYAQALDSIIITQEDSLLSQIDEFLIQDIINNIEEINEFLYTRHIQFLKLSQQHLSTFRFKPRGYEFYNNTIAINGIQTQSLDSETLNINPNWLLQSLAFNMENEFGNQVIKHQSDGIGYQANLYLAANQVKPKRQIQYTLSNAYQNHHLNATYQSGKLKNDWGISVASSNAWSKWSYVEGNNNDNHQLAINISKSWKDKHELHFISSVQKQYVELTSPVVQELYALKDNYFYNPNWGWQNGEKRSAKTFNLYHQYSLLNYNWQINETHQLSISLAYLSGKKKLSLLDYYHSDNPQADHYSRIPGYYIENGHDVEEDFIKLLQSQWQEGVYGQLDWDRFYETNRYHIDPSFDTEKTRALYLLGSRNSDFHKADLAVNYTYTIKENLHLYSHFQASQQLVENYKSIEDLLGADYYIDWNQFVAIDNEHFKYNNLLQKNNILELGDKYHYHYKINLAQYQWNTQLFWEHDHWQVFGGGQIKYHAFQREGYFQNALFSNHSLGKSPLISSWNYAFKGNVQYRLKNKHCFNAAATIKTVENTYYNTFYNGDIHAIFNPSSPQTMIFSTDISYSISTKRLKATLQLFTTEFMHDKEHYTFYHEGEMSNIHFLLDDVNKRHLGLDLDFKIALHPHLSLSGLASYYQAFYTNSSSLKIIKENDPLQLVKESKVYWKNYALSTGPQSAYALSIQYFHPKYFFVQFDQSFTHRMFERMNPLRLKKESVDLLSAEQQLYQDIVFQDKIRGVYYANISIGKQINLHKIWYVVPESTFIWIGFKVKNLFNQLPIIQAQQQYRFDLTDRNPYLFPSKYRYGYGRHYMLSLSIVF